ncbi:MAG: DUF1318 domain-containing protein, partial [Betaproteobacteria bacterium HGW-Betaproteobacteria-8]
MNRLFLSAIFALSFFFMQPAAMAADIEINTPAISAIKNSMQARHNQLAPHYTSG